MNASIFFPIFLRSKLQAMEEPTRRTRPTTRSQTLWRISKKEDDTEMISDSPDHANSTTITLAPRLKEMTQVSNVQIHKNDQV